MIYLFIAISFFFQGSIPPVTTAYDIIIKNGRVLDGTGESWFYADIGIVDDRISAMGDLKEGTAEKIIEAGGLYIAPGFIDVHSHAESGLQSRELSSARPLLAQGITTVVINNDGSGAADLSAQEENLLLHGLGVNVIQLIPHGTVRRMVIGNEKRNPSMAELSMMQSIVREGMEYGAFGISTGLFYVPGSFAETEEIAELAGIVAEYGGIHSSHIRDESDYSIGVVAAVDEIIEISEKAKLPGVISHIKTLGPGVWGYSDTLVQRINKARINGIELYADQYPYNASATSLSAAVIPQSIREGGMNILRLNLDDEKQTTFIREAITDNIKRRGGADRILISEFPQDRNMEGKNLLEISDSLNINAADVVIKFIRIGDPSIISLNMHENDIKLFMQQPWTMTSSDGALVAKGIGRPHPRNYGPFSRKIRKYVMEESVISLEAAIRSMTSLPASVFRLDDRGVIRTGAIADMVIFDLHRIRDVATYSDPHHLSEGMVYVLVNGKLVIEQEEFTDGLHGKVLKKSTTP